MKKPKLIYLMGASGSGKDSLMRYARSALADQQGLIFAHRYITRSYSDPNENHIELSRAEFSDRVRLGCFAVTWESHNSLYGIGIEAEAWLKIGATVVVNGSRQFLAQAIHRFRDNIQPVLVEVAHSRLEARLEARAREGLEDRAARLAHHQLVSAAISTNLGVSDHLPAESAAPSDEFEIQTIDNNGALEVAGQAFVHLITSYMLSHSNV